MTAATASRDFRSMDTGASDHNQLMLEYEQREQLRNIPCMMNTNLIRIMQQTNSPEGCTACSAVFSNETDLLTHIANHLTQLKLHFCKDCDCLCLGDLFLKPHSCAEDGKPNASVRRVALTKSSAAAVFNIIDASGEVISVTSNQTGDGDFVEVKSENLPEVTTFACHACQLGYDSEQELQRHVCDHHRPATVKPASHCSTTTSITSGMPALPGVAEEACSSNKCDKLHQKPQVVRVIEKSCPKRKASRPRPKSSNKKRKRKAACTDEKDCNTDTSVLPMPSASNDNVDPLELEIAENDGMEDITSDNEDYNVDCISAFGDSEYVCTLCRVILQTETGVNQHRESIYHRVQVKDWKAGKVQKIDGSECVSERDVDKLSLVKCSSKRGPFKCPDCAVEFKWIKSMLRHRIIHSKTGGKPYQCQMCSAAFSRAYLLKNHTQKHKGESPHACKICGKHFFDNSSLKRHMRIHTGERPYVCEFCGSSYNQSIVLKHHKCIAKSLILEPTTNEEASSSNVEISASNQTYPLTNVTSPTTSSNNRSIPNINTANIDDINNFVFDEGVITCLNGTQLIEHKAPEHSKTIASAEKQPDQLIITVQLSEDVSAKGNESFSFGDDSYD